ncbi:putative protein C16orf59 like protein [Willisornis vidua]|uniref:TEDC2 protein n=1 Tax=Willisornis vidua TaxID=1566151 RepID=A0ABQ9D235_9PASS|nr:putative protein C16orf59 like protein [Willisornis vidua]
MLPAGRGGRAAAALREALGAGAERRRDLERRAERGRALLRRWNAEQEEDKEEQPHGQSGSSTALENRPSAKELEELELLNRALEKALKVRKSILKTSSEAQGATGQKLAGERPAPKKAEEQQVPVPVEDVPESTKGMAEMSSVPNKCRCSSCKGPFHGEDPDNYHPTLQGEYESLLTLEGLQSTVAQFLQKLQLLRAALECQLRLRPGCTGDVGSCSARCAPARGQACDPARLLALPLLCYSSCQELRDLFALKLQVSMLHQEIALQKVLMAELLPVLEPRPCPEGCARLFRAIHTQLCQGGSSFPVLVRDELLD